MKRRQFLAVVGVGLATALSAISRSGRAQSYPSRPIRLVVPFPPGGAFDTLGRPLGDKLKSLLGTIVIENIGGSGSSLGASAVAHAPPDGYTILLGGTLPHVNEALLKSRPLYDPVKDLAPISIVAANFLSIAIHPSVPAQTLKQFVDYAKANPGKLSYGHVGIGSTNHLTGELFKSLTGTPEIVQVPYRGAGPAIADLISGHIPVAVVAVTGQVIELHRSAKIRVLAITGAKRLAAAPELPTAVEAGLAGLTVRASLGLLAPGGTPRSIIDQIAQATRAALGDQTFQQTLIGLGFEPDLSSNPETFRRSLEDDVALWRPIVKALDLKID
jgi:tripartite-type tricarboxylate transporter receptor subunit TctC